VIDGWGIPSDESPKDGDAITNAQTPVMDELYKSETGFTELDASSLAVGLPEGLMGNSEVGHLNIGAGRVVWQDVVRIDQSIKKGEFSSNETIKKTFEGAANGNGRLHLCGLVSHGGVVRHPLLSKLPSIVKSLTQMPALQANPPVCPSQGGQGVQGPQGLHSLLRRWP
jgi:2,3-bisphosphoglycerate-independent phosphoglycerate mutase